jgi:DNA segregation ATPase FtsK/SpoIIIE, S-DNA-T family
MPKKVQSDNLFTKIKIARIAPDIDSDAKISLAIIVSFATSILIFLSILGKAGTFGEVIGSFIVAIFGRAAFILPVLCFWIGLVLIKIQKNLQLGENVNPRLVWGVILLLSCFSGFLNIFFGVDSIANMEKGGGLYGYIFYPLFFGRFDVFGGAVCLLSIGLFGFFLITQLSFVEFLETLKQAIKDPKRLLSLVPDIFELTILDKPVETMDGKVINQDKVDKNSVKVDSLNDLTKNKIIKKIIPQNSSLKIPLSIEDLQKKYLDPSEVTTKKYLSPASLSKNKITDLNWKLPSFDILRESKTQSVAGDVEGNKKIIQETLENFNIPVEMDGVVTGPTVSQYTLKPQKGVKLSAIDSLQRDLALALAASSIRLEAPIPGKSLVGIEIPNKVKSQVRLKQILQSNEFIEFESDLPVAIGVDVAGEVLISSVAKMPHLLVAGATGAGKSVWINAMLLSLLYRYTPFDLQLILVDMKRVELKLYDNIPHLLAPVITDSEKAINALKWTVLEMDRRYKLLEEFGKRNIADYNRYSREQNEFQAENQVETKIEELESQNESQNMSMLELPYLVFVIDELGDLMMIAKNEVEPIVVRLTQMSRAVGIHLVLGTQRPDTHVVTGLIKANVPSRIAFTVASQIDSRVILDQSGAEKLLGQGDGLYMSPNSMKAVRFQGCFVEELEVRKCCNFWISQVLEDGLPKNLNPEVTQPLKAKITVPGLQNEDNSEDSDDIYERCKKFVISQQQASTSMLQTAFGIGYPKARKIIDNLTKEGIVGPPNGSKPREVYIENVESYE